MRTKNTVVNKKKRPGWFQKTIAWIHLWPSLVAAVILIFVCLTGTILVYSDEVMDWTTGDARYIKEVNGKQLSSTQLLEIIKKEFPKRRSSYVVYYNNPHLAVRFNTYQEGLGLRMVYINQYTGEILKDNPCIYFFYITAHLHDSLLLGKPGAWIVDIATLIFLVELITGLILWWPKRWTKTTREASFKIKWKASFKRINYDLHNVLGFYALSICLVLTVTGLIIAFHPLQDITIRSFGGDPEHDWMYTLAPHKEDANSLSIDQVLLDLFQQHPEKKEAKVWLYNLDETGYYMVSLGRSIGLKSVEAHLPIAVNRYSGQEIRLTYPQKMHIIVENSYWNLHMGKWMGPLGKFFTFTGGLIATSLPITGFIIWWGRRKKKKKSSQSSP